MSTASPRTPPAHTCGQSGSSRRGSRARPAAPPPSPQPACRRCAGSAGRQPEPRPRRTGRTATAAPIPTCRQARSSRTSSDTSPSGGARHGNGTTAHRAASAAPAARSGPRAAGCPAHRFQYGRCFSAPDRPAGAKAQQPSPGPRKPTTAHRPASRPAPSEHLPLALSYHLTADANRPGTHMAGTLAQDSPRHNRTDPPDAPRFVTSPAANRQRPPVGGWGAKAGRLIPPGQAERRHPGTMGRLFRQIDATEACIRKQFFASGATGSRRRHETDFQTSLEIQVPAGREICDSELVKRVMKSPVSSVCVTSCRYV